MADMVTLRLQHQTTFGGPDSALPERGNCLAACVASLLGKDLAEIPNFCEAEDWYSSYADWLGGCGLMPLVFDNDPTADFVQYRHRAVLIASGKSPRGDFEHCVLWRDGRLLFDPHPSEAGLAGQPTSFDMLMIIGPAPIEGNDDEAS